MIPFGCFCFIGLLFHVFSLGLSLINSPVVVILGESALLSCVGTCSGHITWTSTVDQQLKVVKCVQKTCTEGQGFINRVKTRNGNLSLTIDPTVYNDRGWYEARCDLTIVCHVFLDVLVPTIVNASAGDNVTLTCHAHTDKLITDDAVNILWRKDNQIALQVKNGITNYGSGFKERASVSVNRYSDGDLSLTIFRIQKSDQGLYQCYHSIEEKKGHPAAVIVNIKAHQNLHAKKVGDNLTLDLFGSDHVKVTFNGHDAAETLVCSMIGNNTTCSPEYTHRVSIINDFLVLSRLRSSDRGTFTLKDKMGEVISVSNVEVSTTGVALKYHIIIVALLSVFIILHISLFCRCQETGRSPAVGEIKFFFPHYSCVLFVSTA